MKRSCSNIVNVERPIKLPRYLSMHIFVNLTRAVYAVRVTEDSVKVNKTQLVAR